MDFHLGSFDFMLSFGRDEEAEFFWLEVRKLNLCKLYGGTGMTRVEPEGNDYWDVFFFTI